MQETLSCPISKGFSLDSANRALKVLSCPGDLNLPAKDWTEFQLLRS